MPRPKKRSQKRANGEGSVYWDEEKQRYVAAVSLGVNPNSGKPKRKKVSVKTQQEVLDKKRELEMKLHQGVRVDKDKVTVSEWLDQWLELYKYTDLRDTTYPSYESELKLHVKPHINGKRCILIPN